MHVQDTKAPLIFAIDECPQWPTWVLADASKDIQQQLGLYLQFYDVPHRQWVACLPSYPHDVTKDGYLLLRHPSTVDLMDFDVHLSHACEKPIHLRYNLAGDRADIRQRLQERRKAIYVPVIEISDDEGGSSSGRGENPAVIETPCTMKRKRSVHDDEATSHPSHRQWTISTQSPSPCATSPSPFSLPSSPSPIPSIQPVKIHVPDSSKPWPHGMYTVDMATGFLQVDSAAPGARHLKARLYEVFRKEIPTNTYHDQRRHWSRATESQRQRFRAAGHTDQGLWSAFRNSLR